MYGGNSKASLAATGVAVTVGHYTFGLPVIVGAGLGLVVVGVLSIRVFGRNKRYVP